MADKSAFSKFLDENTRGPLNQAFLGLSAIEIAQSDNKLKALIKTLAQMVFFKPLIAIGLAGAFSAMGKSIRAVLADTGSLEAALKKLTQIQGLQRLFAPLVGGAEAARAKVAALVNFAASNKLNFGNVGEAARGLQVQTRGAYAGVEAMQAVGDTAAATGNDVRDTAEAVGAFYAAMREGQPVAAVSERLREMGIVSDANILRMTALQQSGASGAAVFGELTRTLQENSGAMRRLAGDIATVDAAYGAAKSNLKEKFASPWVKSDVENTRNITEAMNAVAPSVARVASFLERLTNGFSMAYSWLAKTAAQSPILTAALENTVIVVSTLVAGISAVSAISLASWLLSAASGMVAFSGATAIATVAVRGLGLAMAATGIGLLLAVVGTAAGIYMNFTQSAERATKALDEQRRANQQVADAMDKQIRSARTLREHQEALAKAAQNTKDAQQAVTQALQEQAEASVDRTGIRGSVARIKGWFGSDDQGFTRDAAADARVTESQRNLMESKRRERAQRDLVDEMKKRGILSPERAQTNIDLAKSRALVGGNQQEVVRLSNLASYAENFERLRSQYGDEGARQRALSLTSGQIAEQAAAPAASSLARIGLGGEFGGGTDVQKQIRDLSKDMVEYLRSIDAKVTPNGNSNNEPAEYDGT